MGWLLSTGAVGSQRTAPMRLRSSQERGGWSLTATVAAGAAAKVWQSVLTEMTGGVHDKSEKEAK
jgi:hypothetical protein